MIEIAIEGNPGFRLSTVDLDRPGPSFTSDTLERLHELLRRAHGEPVEIFFIVGQDAINELSTWYRPERVLEQATLVAFKRPGIETIPLDVIAKRLPTAAERIIQLDGPELRLSSSELRARAESGLPLRYLVPDRVCEYIADTRLYRPK